MCVFHVLSAPDVFFPCVDSTGCDCFVSVLAAPGVVVLTAPDVVVCVDSKHPMWLFVLTVPNVLTAPIVVFVCIDST